MLNEIKKDIPFAKKRIHGAITSPDRYNLFDKFISNLKNIIMASDWKDRLGVVFSTNPDFAYNTNEESEPETLAPAKQNLKVWLDRLKGGRVATVVRGYVGSADDLAELGKELKKSCGVGGTAKDGEIIIQGDHRDRVVELLTKAGYKCKKAGG